MSIKNRLHKIEQQRAVLPTEQRIVVLADDASPEEIVRWQRRGRKVHHLRDLLQLIEGRV